MHVLCAPPAFILSQDQTLILNMFEFIAHFKSVFIVFLLSKFLYLVVQLTTAFIGFSKDSLFTFQCTLYSFHFLFLNVSVWNVFYYTMHFSICQHFFQSFFKLFFDDLFINFSAKNKELVLLSFCSYVRSH